jgi:eukaryotic-like serine/threonine-protein kinase
MTQPAKILIVDDTADNRDLLSRRLKSGGYEIITADNGATALELVGREKPDLVVLDWMMPGLTGIDVLKAIRRRYSNLEMPVIMATAKDQTDDMVVALGHGANDYVVKPLDFPVLLARIQSQLRSKAEMKPAEQKLRPGDLRPGLVLAEKYRIEQEIGSGNFGIVFKATHLDLQQPVALKILSAAIDEKDSADLERLRLEGASAFRLQHPNAVHVLDFAFAHGLAFLVMELLDGTTLERFLQQEKRLSPRRAVEIVGPICEVLAQAHQLGIIHRDIKPANIFLQKTPRGEVVKVLDFGIAKFVGDSAVGKNLTLDEGILGTPIYIAPERLSSQDYDGRADVYSVGIMLYQMVAGTLPFAFHKKEPLAIAVQHLTAQPERLQTHVPEVSIHFESVVMSTLKKTPGERPSASELAAKLRQAIDPQSRSPRHEISEETTGVILQRRERAAAVAAKTAEPAESLEAGDTTILAGSVTARLAFDFGDLLEPPPRPLPANVLPVVPPRDGAGPWS